MEFLRIGALFPFLFGLVVVKYIKIEIFDEKERFLLEVLFELKVDFFSLFFIVTGGFDEFPFVF